MLAATALLIAAVAGAPPSEPERLRDQATAAYRRGDLARACPLFQRFARAHPSDGEAWSDLGLCLAKQGRKRDALDALDRAISVGDEPARLHAYHNLGAFKLRELPFPPPETPSAPECKPIPAVAGCSAAWWACSVSYSFTGTSYTQEGRGVFVGPRLEAEKLAGAVNEETEFDVLYARSNVESCDRDCDRYHGCGWCPRSSEDRGDKLEVLAPRIQACVKETSPACAGVPADAAACAGVRAECEDSTCSTMDGLPKSSLSPAERRQKQRLDACMDECRAGCIDEQENPMDGCAVVSVNPCARAVGIVCREGGTLRARELPAKRARGG